MTHNMAPALSNLSHPGWHGARVMAFEGQRDTHIHTGEDYSTLTLGHLFSLEPGRKDKGSSAAFIPSSYCDYDGREHARQRERGEFVALCGDVDSGDHPLEQIVSLVERATSAAAWLIYSSAHARPGDRRWRIVLPLEAAVDFTDWHDAQLAFFALMEAGGVKMDAALARAAQPVYLPNVPSVHAKSGTALRSETGEPLYYQRASSAIDAPGLALTAGPVADGIAAIRAQRDADDRERERIRQQAARRRRETSNDDGMPIIADFNGTTSVATMLEMCGYEQSPRSPEDWRSPLQTGDTYATRIMGDKWVSLSESDAAAGLGEKCASGCYGDAYDLFVHYKHGGDHKAAFRTLYAERRDSSPERARERPHQEPSVVNGDPGWQEPREARGGDTAPDASRRETLVVAERTRPQRTSNWPAPDMALLAGGRAKAVPMPGDLFGNLWPLMLDLAKGAGAPVDYVALGVLSVSASLIGAKRRVKPFASADWVEPCILWAAAVGDPSFNKSPAIDAATRPLRPMEADHAEGHSDALRKWEAVAERAKVERKAWEKDVEQARKENSTTPPLPISAVAPDAPERRRLLVQDSTPEALAVILAGNPMGTFHLRDELAGWWASFERYAPGGREFWLEAYGGRVYTVDRKGAQSALRIPFNGVSVFGGVQPEKLADALLAQADDGLVPRFLWAWPERVEWVRPTKPVDADRLELVYRCLEEEIRPDYDARGALVPIDIALEPEAADLFEEWLRDHMRSFGEAASLFKSFCGKLQGTVLRLSLISELLHWADSGSCAEPTAISTASIAAAVTFVEEYAKPTALRVFGDAALPPVERNAAALARHIVKNSARRINQRDIQRNSGIPALKTLDTLKEAIEHLVESDWLRPAGTRSGDTPGRTKGDYLVNPAVLAQTGE